MIQTLSQDARQAMTDAARIADAIAYLEDHWRRKPSLDDVAEHVGLSKHHFQRLFSRWAGVSPKRFMQYLTIDRARELLAGGLPLLDAALDLDLSGPSRLHDLFVTIDAVTPGDFKRRGDGLDIRFGVHPSPFGWCVIGLTGRGICFLGFTDDDDHRAAADIIQQRWPRARLVHAPNDTKPLAGRVFAATDAASAPAPLPVMLTGTNFQLKVWEALLRIPAGAVTTYQQIADAVGQSSASRAVGQAVGANPISYLIPCHRVLRKDGAVGGYAWGPSRKRAILWRESAQRAEREEQIGG
jgi:AraC family transcriptional regulator of adaptative response/methylated-DNA-[protein]-cysteine methyltransferase